MGNSCECLGDRQPSIDEVDLDPSVSTHTVNKARVTINSNVANEDAKVPQDQNADYAHALFRLGHAYENGTDGMPKDHTKAFECFRRGSDLGYSKAQLRVAFYYDVGLGVSEDAVKAVFWYQKAATAETPEPKAQFSLALCYAKGIGVNKSATTSFYWFKRAADLGYDRAMYNLGYCLEQGLGCEKNFDEAIALYRHAASLGNSLARKRLSIHNIM